MKFFFDKPVPVSCEYGVPRQTAEGIHTGRDYAVAVGTPILAPEDGLLHLQMIRQHDGIGTDKDGKPVVVPFRPDLLWPDGTFWPYSRYYEWWAGCVAILFGKTWTHVWLHIDPWYLMVAWEAHGRMYKQAKLRKPSDYSGYVIPWINWMPIRTLKGDMVAPVGISGYDTEAHVHYQLMKQGRQRHVHVDPREVWG